MRQMVVALAQVHSVGAAHRDLKPENLLVREVAGSPADEGSRWVLRLGDFGSAVDAHTLKHLYGALGPLDAQQTEAYAAPEVRRTLAGWREELAG